MARVLIGAVIVAVIAIILYFVLTSRYNDKIAAQQQEIDGLSHQLSQLNDQNTQLKAELAKVQSEEANLAAQNDALNKALATVKTTGKLPKNAPALPYPPK